MVTRALLPLKLSALPFLPSVDQVAVPIVPPLPVPDASATVVPVPSSNEYAATRPGVRLCAWAVDSWWVRRSALSTSTPHKPKVRARMPLDDRCRMQPNISLGPPSRGEATSSPLDPRHLPRGGRLLM
jgi:hypothetical protein